MKKITITFHLTNDYGLKAIEFTENETELNEDSNLLELLSIATLKSIYDNKKTIIQQDILNSIISTVIKNKK